MLNPFWIEQNLITGGFPDLEKYQEFDIIINVSDELIFDFIGKPYYWFPLCVIVVSKEG